MSDTIMIAPTIIRKRVREEDRDYIMSVEDALVVFRSEEEVESSATTAACTRPLRASRP